MYNELLIQLGLSKKEAAVYEKLVEKGSLTAGKLLKELPYKRGDMYYLLSRLKEKGLISEALSRTGVVVFTAENPSTLHALAERDLERVKQLKTSVEAALPNLKSLYNLAMGRPGVRFYEGEEGVWKVLNDTLESKTELLYFGDNDAIEKYIPSIDVEYVRKRKRRRLSKRLIMFDTRSARLFAHEKQCDPLTKVRLISVDATEVRSMMHIYDGKVSYVTFLKNAMIGILIEDIALYELHRTIFEYVWKAAASQVAKS